MTAAPVKIRIDPSPGAVELRALLAMAFGATPDGSDPTRVHSRALGHIGAYEGENLVGYVNIAWDGGIHAFLLDPAVHPNWQRRGIGTMLVESAIALAREREARWLHVDFEPGLTGFYRPLGFRSTEAGLIDLAATRG